MSEVRSIQDTKKTAKKKRRPLKVMMSTLAFAIACLLTYDSLKEVFTTIQLKQNIEASEQELAQIKKDTKELKTEKKNLEDPDYVLRYARGKFMVTKKVDGEQVFKLPSKDK
ncbi:septum formation initiator family protein [Copranaerobaculum intestinale]|uniref:septum formation initiator family protein n=1 Tax=Copranaerobaculum intestinale TaxID=2692629 RepID=UPI0032219A4E